MRAALFIEGSYLYGVSRKLGFDVDYKEFLAFWKKREVLRAYYYAALLESSEHTPLKPFVDWLAYNGYAVTIKEAYRIVDREGRERNTNMSLTSDIVIDLMEQAANFDRLILVTGSADYRRVIETVQRRGVLVTVVASTTAAMISDDLRRQADQFIEIGEIASHFTRTRTEG